MLASHGQATRIMHSRGAEPHSPGPGPCELARFRHKLWTMTGSGPGWLPLLLAAAAPSAGEPPQKSHLLAPTPREAMREMTTDRPDITESPFTVDAGHLQLELDALAVERDEGESELWLGTTNLRLGLTPAIDLHVIVEPWRHVEGATGFGDLTLRAKLNLWGNDGGATALGVIGFVRLPTAAAGLGAEGPEGGLILPLAFELPAELELSTMLELDASRRDDGYGTDLVVTGSLGRDLWGELAGYVELASTLPLDATDESELLASGGLILDVLHDLALDSGARVGLTRAAPDLAWFIGGTLRY